MRRRILHALAAPLVLLALAMLPCARDARADTFGQYGSAQTLPVNGHSLGAQLEFGKSTIALMAQLRMSLYPDVDFGFQGGIAHYDLSGSDVTTARLGGDFRYQTAHFSRGAAVDFAIGAFIGLESGDRFGQLSIGPTAVVSRPVSINGTERMIPYGSMQVRFAQFYLDGSSNNDVSFPLRVGSEFPIMTGVRAVAEIQFRVGDDFQDDVSYGFGANFDF